MSVKKKQLIGFNANEELASELKQRVESLGLTMSDYLKGLVRRDLDASELDAWSTVLHEQPDVPQLPSARKAQRRTEKKQPRADVPEKSLGRDIAVLIAWFLGLREVLQHVNTTDVALVATHYTAEDTTRPEVLRKAVREALTEAAHRVPVWKQQFHNFLNRNLS